MLSMGWRRQSIRTWRKLFGLGLFALPALSVLDIEAFQQRLDSVYIGKLSAAWIDAGYEGCGERLLGELDNSTLIFGPTHDPRDTNPYFVSLVSPETSSLTVSMQSSISSQQLVKVWWEVEARLGRSDREYSVSGTLKNNTCLQKNTFSGSFAKMDSDWCGIKKQSFIWEPEVDTSMFSGTISAQEVAFSIDGSMRDETTSRLISYVIQFHGKWDPTSAKLHVDKSTPTWPEPGNTDATEQPNTPPILVDSSRTPMVGVTDDDTGKLASGGVVGITTAAILVLGFSIMAISCFIQRRRRPQKDGKVYPEIAYVYTPSPDPSVDSSEGYSKILAHYNSDLEVRQVLVNNYSLPVTNEHQWREF